MSEELLVALFNDDGPLDVQRVAEIKRLRAIVLSVADSPVIRSDADGFDYCAVCGSSQEYAGMLQHEDDCAYLAALLYRQALADKLEKQA